MIRLRLHIVLLFFVAALTSFAQNLKVDYKLHYKAMESIESYALEEVHYEYDSLNTGGEIARCVVNKHKDNIHMSVGEIENITTKKQFLEIDHEDLHMSLYQILDTGKIMLNESDSLIENFISSFDTIVFLEQKNNLKAYSLQLQDGDIKEVQLFFNAQNNLLVKQAEYYRFPYLNDGVAKNIVVYNYTDANKEEISIEKYIELKNGRYSLKKEYQNYELETF